MAETAAVPENLPAGFTDWELNLVDAAKKDAAGRWALIDRLAEGKALFEPALFWAAVKAAGLSRGTVNNRLSIHNRFPVSRRRENLLPAIHDEFRTLDDGLLPVALERAEEYRWTREQARMRMKAFKGGDVTALEAGWTPPPVKSKQQKEAEAEASAEGGEGGDGEDKAGFDRTSVGAAMSAEERREVLDGYADQKFASGNDFFDKIARTIEGKGDPRRFTRECDLKRLSPARARALAAFFAEVAEAAEKAQRGAINSQSGSAAPDIGPGDRERLGSACTSGDEVVAGDGNPEREGTLPIQSSHLADEFEDGNAASEHEELAALLAISVGDEKIDQSMMYELRTRGLLDGSIRRYGEGLFLTAAGIDRLEELLARRGGASQGGAELQSGCPDQAPDGRPAESGSGEISASHSVTQTGSSSGAASGDDDLEIPAFLRRGHQECAVEGGDHPPVAEPEGPQGREGASADA